MTKIRLFYHFRLFPWSGLKNIFFIHIAKYAWGLFIFESQITHLEFYKNPCMGTLSKIELKMLKKNYGY